MKSFYANLKLFLYRTHFNQLNYINQKILIGTRLNIITLEPHASQMYVRILCGVQA